MRPVPIEDHLVEALGGGRRIVMSAPNGDLTDTEIAPLEVLSQQQADGTPLMTSVWRLEGDDLERLIAGGLVALVCVGGQPPVGMLVVS